MNREDFPMLNKDLIYFDNGATTYKPKTVIDAMIEYYSEYNASAYRGDYDNAAFVDKKMETARELTRSFINGKEACEIIFTNNATEALNMIVNGYYGNILKEGDEILTTKTEHASLILPWLVLAKKKNLIIKYIPLDENFTVTIENIKKVITNKTKVIAIAGITNTFGDLRPVHEVGLLCKEKGISFMVDGAQSVPHSVTDVTQDNIDFLAFSAHKMLGPTGVGILYGKRELLELLEPQRYGGGMNVSYNSDEIFLKDLPTRLEGGTPNIAGIIGYAEALKYLLKIGMKNIANYEHELKEYAIQKLKNNDDFIIYNMNNIGGTVLLKHKEVFSQDVAIYLNKHHIAIRSGNHCAKTIKELINTNNTCRISFAFYNTKEEIDKLARVLDNKNLLKESI